MARVFGVDEREKVAVPRVTFRDLAEKQHGPSKAIRDLRPLYGGWLVPVWCKRCEGLLTLTDREAGYCTVCGEKKSR
jgi:hypothetical protein